MLGKRIAVVGLNLMLAFTSACSFSVGRGRSTPLPIIPDATPIPPSPIPDPTQMAGGFTTPAYDIDQLSPAIYPPAGFGSADCLQGPEPDWTAPSARLFDWPNPFSLENRLLCIYGFASSGEGWGFSIELTDPSGSVYSESFTLIGDDLVGELTGPHRYVPSEYEGVDYIGLPLFFGDPRAEGEWKVSARTLDGTLVLEETAIVVEGLYGTFILSAPPGNPFAKLLLEEAADGQTAYIYLVGGNPNSEYVIALYSIDPDTAAEFDLDPGEPVPMEILAISSLVPRFATIVTSDADGNVETEFYVDASIPAGEYFLVELPGPRGNLGLSLNPMLVRHD